MTKIEKKIIKLLSNYPMGEFYGQEIVKKVGCSKGAASAILKAFYAKKIVFKKTRGRMNFYQINQNHPEIRQFRIDSALEAVRPALTRLEKLAIKVILFGSASRGEQTIGSDFDLLIITNQKEQARLAIKKTKLSSRIKSIIKTPSEWSEMEIKEPEFYKEVNRGITLHNYVSRI